jgi:hypothetical protein
MIWCYYIDYCASRKMHVKVVWSIMDFCVLVYGLARCCVVDRNMIWSNHVSLTDGGQQSK